MKKQCRNCEDIKVVAEINNLPIVIECKKDKQRRASGAFCTFENHNTDEHF